MKIKLFIVSFILATLWGCTSSRQVVKLRNHVEDLENTLSDEIQKNRVLSSLRFFITPDCIKQPVPVMKSVKTIVIDDSLCIKYNSLLDKYNQLLMPSLTLENDFNTHFAKSDSIISMLRTEYKSIKKSSR
jgi:hypothetical protein